MKHAFRTGEIKIPCGCWTWKRFLILFYAATFYLLSGCNPRSLSTKASIQITEVPIIDQGGPVQMGFIAGRAAHAKPDQKVVVYAHSGIWWIQPFASQSFTKLQPDSTWRNTTHLGTDYAALLVEPGYHAASKLEELPAVGNGVVAVAVSAGEAGKQLASKTIHFSGYDWQVETIATDRGGQTQVYAPENVWTDDKGFLHLRIQEQNGVWTCGQVSLVRSLGYGTYIFVVRDISQLGPAAALSLYSRDDFRIDETPSELDIEISRWGVAASKNAQYVVQPFYDPENVARFTAPSGVLTHMLHWEPGRASFATALGSTVDQRTPKIAEHVFTSNIPTPAKEAVHIGLSNYKRTKESPLKKEEVVIERFEFLP